MAFEDLTSFFQNPSVLKYLTNFNAGMQQGFTQPGVTPSQAIGMGSAQALQGQVSDLDRQIARQQELELQAKQQEILKNRMQGIIGEQPDTADQYGQPALMKKALAMTMSGDPRIMQMGGTLMNVASAMTPKERWSSVPVTVNGKTYDGIAQQNSLTGEIKYAPYMDKLINSGKVEFNAAYGAFVDKDTGQPIVQQPSTAQPSTAQPSTAQPKNWPTISEDIKAFQKSQGLTTDGIIGPKTTEALNKQGYTKPTEPGKVTTASKGQNIFNTSEESKPTVERMTMPAGLTPKQQFEWKIEEDKRVAKETADIAQENRRQAFEKDKDTEKLFHTASSVRNQLDSAAQLAQDMNDEIAALKKNKIGLTGITGILGTLPSVPGFSAAKAQNTFDNIKGKITSMGKEVASKSGSPGSISEKEWKIMSDQFDAIDPVKLGAEGTLAELDKIAQRLDNMQSTASEQFNAEYGNLLENEKYAKKLQFTPAKSVTSKQQYQEAQIYTAPNGTKFKIVNGRAIPQ